jgi:outer membrane protein
MKMFPMKPLPTVCCILLLAFSAVAEQKIAIIDLKKVFDDYYKTRLADASIKEEATGLDKDRKALLDDYQKSADDYKKALDDANNQAISGDEREKRKKETEAKLIKLNDLEQTIKQFDRTARGNLEEKQRQAREKILAEIRMIVTAKAKAGGFSLVLDTAGEGLSHTPIVFYTVGENDLTAPVIAQLNATAPPDFKTDDKK